MNELLWVVLLLVNFAAVLIAFRLFGKTGLYIWIAASAILANIQVLKTVEIFGFVATLGNIIYGTSFLATDILNEIYGKDDARQGVWIGFFILISMTAIMQVGLYFIPHSSDFSQQALQTIFGFMPRVVIASLIAYLLSQTHDVWAYAKWKKKFSGDNQIWIRNNLSTMVSQLIDSAIFCLIAFAGVFSWGDWWSILITTYLLKWVVAAADTPFIYLAKRLYNNGKIPTDLEKEIA